MHTGNGAGFTKLFERLIRGVWTPTAMEFMQPSLYVEIDHVLFSGRNPLRLIMQSRFKKIYIYMTILFYSPTKASMIASIIFVLDKKTDLISAPHALVYFGIVIFFVYFKVKPAASLEILCRISSARDAI